MFANRDQPGLYPGEIAFIAPMCLCREVQDLLVCISIEIRPSGVNGLGAASCDVILIHRRIGALEFQRDAFAHNADTINGVDDCLGWRCEEVSVVPKDKHNEILLPQSSVRFFHNSMHNK